MTQKLKLVAVVVFVSYIGISLGGWQDKILKLKIPEPKIPKPKYPKLKYSKS